MTELLKVLKFLLKRAKKGAFKALSRVKPYKGLYAFLGGIMVFSLCFAGKGNSGFFAYNGSFIALSLPAAAGIVTDIIEDADSPVPLPDAGALLSLGEISGEKVRRVPYNVFNNEVEALSLGAIDGIAAETVDYDENDVPVTDDNNEETAPEKKNGETNGNENAEAAPEEDSGEETSAETEPEIVPEKEKEEPDSQWQRLDEIKYVNTDLIYSRKEAKEGSEKINRYRINDPVEVDALTDTHYYRLKSGEFIHEDYLSSEESAKWTETAASGLMYVRKGGIYSREEALEGSAKVSKYNLNDTVTVTAITNTNYYKIAEGEFIHSDYLSTEESVDYPLSDQYGQRAQTASEQALSQQVFDVVNSVRAEYGLAPFKQLDSLNAAAAERAWETTVYNSHTRPDGTKCFTILDEYGLKNPSTKAENIAKWYSSAQAVVNSWMSDYAHRSAILGNHEYMGVGCYYMAGDYYGYYWAQVFYTP